MKRTACCALIALVGLVSGAADAAIATFHCDAAPVDECHYTVFQAEGARPVQVVKGGDSLVVEDVDGHDSYCRAVNQDPDLSHCQHQPVPLDADFKNRVDPNK